MKAWDDALVDRLRARAERSPEKRGTLTSILTLAGLRERLAAAQQARTVRYAPSRPWGEWSSEAIEALRLQIGGGGDEDLRPPESDGRPYELRVLHYPGKPDGGAESRWYHEDSLALRAFVMARALLADPELGLGLAIFRDGCLVYEWTEPAGSNSHELDVAPHRRRGCAGHEAVDIFDRLARVYDHYCGMGYREGGCCSRLCAEACPGEHVDLLAAMIRAEAYAISEIADESAPQPLSGGPGGHEVPVLRPSTRSIVGFNPQRRTGPGTIRPRP